MLWDAEAESLSDNPCSATRMAKDYVNVYRMLLKQGARVDAPPLVPSMSPREYAD